MSRGEFQVGTGNQGQHAAPDALGMPDLGAYAAADAANVEPEGDPTAAERRRRSWRQQAMQAMRPPYPMGEGDRVSLATEGSFALGYSPGHVGRDEFLRDPFLALYGDAAVGGADTFSKAGGTNPRGLNRTPPPAPGAPGTTAPPDEAVDPVDQHDFDAQHPGPTKPGASGTDEYEPVIDVPSNLWPFLELVEPSGSLDYEWMYARTRTGGLARVRPNPDLSPTQAKATAQMFKLRRPAYEVVVNGVSRLCTRAGIDALWEALPQPPPLPRDEWEAAFVTPLGEADTAMVRQEPMGANAQALMGLAGIVNTCGHDGVCYYEPDAQRATLVFPDTAKKKVGPTSALLQQLVRVPHVKSADVVFEPQEPGSGQQGGDLGYRGDRTGPHPPLMPSTYGDLPVSLGAWVTGYDEDLGYELRRLPEWVGFVPNAVSQEQGERHAKKVYALLQRGKAGEVWQWWKTGGGLPANEGLVEAQLTLDDLKKYLVPRKSVVMGGKWWTVTQRDLASGKVDFRLADWEKGSGTRSTSIATILRNVNAGKWGMSILNKGHIGVDSPRFTGNNKHEAVDEARRPRIYLVMYGGYWSVTPAAVHEILRRIQSGEEYDLDQLAGSKRLRSRPSGVYVDADGDRPASSDPNVLVFTPLDWKPADVASIRATLKRAHVESVDEGVLPAAVRKHAEEQKFQVVDLGQHGRFHAWTFRDLTPNSQALLAQRHGKDLPTFLRTVHPLEHYTAGRKHPKRFVADPIIDDFDIPYFLARVSKAMDALALPKQPGLVLFREGTASGWMYPGEAKTHGGLTPIRINRAPSSSAQEKYGDWKGPRSPHTLVHEYAHQVWFTALTSAQKQAIQAYFDTQVRANAKASRQDLSAPTDYSLKNVEEWWAEIVGYSMYADRLNPKVAAFIKEVMQGQAPKEPKPPAQHATPEAVEAGGTECAKASHHFYYAEEERGESFGPPADVPEPLTHCYRVEVAFADVDRAADYALALLALTEDVDLWRPLAEARRRRTPTLRFARRKAAVAGGGRAKKRRTLPRFQVGQQVVATREGKTHRGQILHAEFPRTGGASYTLRLTQPIQVHRQPSTTFLVRATKFAWLNVDDMRAAEATEHYVARDVVRDVAHPVVVAWMESAAAFTAALDLAAAYGGVPYRPRPIPVYVPDPTGWLDEAALEEGLVQLVRRYLDGEHQVIHVGTIGWFDVYSALPLSNTSIVGMGHAKTRAEAEEYLRSANIDPAKWWRKVHEWKDYERPPEGFKAGNRYLFDPALSFDAADAREGAVEATGRLQRLGFPKQRRVVVLAPIGNTANHHTGGVASGQAWRVAHGIVVNREYARDVDVWTHEFAHHVFFHLPKDAKQHFFTWYAQNVLGATAQKLSQGMPDRKVLVDFLVNAAEKYQRKKRGHTAADALAWVRRYGARSMSDADVEVAFQEEIFRQFAQGQQTSQPILLFGKLRRALKGPQATLRTGQRIKVFPDPNLQSLTVPVTAEKSGHVATLLRTEVRDALDLDLDRTLVINKHHTDLWGIKSTLANLGNTDHARGVRQRYSAGLYAAFDDPQVRAYFMGYGLHPVGAIFSSEAIKKALDTFEQAVKERGADASFDPSATIGHLLLQHAEWDKASPADVVAARISNPEGTYLRDVAKQVGGLPNSYAAASVDELWAVAVEYAAARQQLSPGLKKVFRDVIQGTYPSGAPREPGPKGGTRKPVRETIHREVPYPDGSDGHLLYHELVMALRRGEVAPTALAMRQYVASRYPTFPNELYFTAADTVLPRLKREGLIEAFPPPFLDGTAWVVAKDFSHEGRRFRTGDRLLLLVHTQDRVTLQHTTLTADQGRVTIAASTWQDWLKDGKVAERTLRHYPFALHHRPHFKPKPPPPEEPPPEPPPEEEPPADGDTEAPPMAGSGGFGPGVEEALADARQGARVSGIPWYVTPSVARPDRMVATPYAPAGSAATQVLPDGTTEMHFPVGD